MPLGSTSDERVTPQSDLLDWAAFRQFFSCSSCGLCLFIQFQRLVCAAPNFTRVDDKARHGLQVKLKTRLDKVRSLEC